jgi:hypothetical protein
MKNKIFYLRNIWTGLIASLVIYAVAGLLTGCATSGTKGTMQTSQELNQKFLNYEVVQGYNYYYSGSFDRPNAILGIHEDYQLVSQLWKPAQVSSAQLAKWIGSIAPEEYRGPSGYSAAYILDPEGKKVGIWYSILNTTTIKFLEGNKIEVNSPDLYPPSKLEKPTGINIGS